MKKRLSISLMLLITFSMLAALSPEVKAQGTPEQLTTNPYRDSHPSWSPDGTKIAYNAFSGSWYRNIWVMNSDGSGKVPLTSGDAINEAPAFSPDATKIAFTHWGYRGDYHDLMIMNSDGTGIQRLTFGGIPGLAEGTYEVPQWSKDGSTLIFGYGEGTTGVHKPWWIGSVRVDGSDLRSLGVRGLNPRFCYDDTKIIFNTRASDYLGDMRIAIMNADGTGVEYLTDGPLDWGPDMSASSHQIVFTHGDPGDLYLMNEDGSDVFPLITDGKNHESTWSPDGKHVAYTSGIGQNYDIWKIEAPICEARGVFIRLSFDDKGIGGGLFTSWEEMETSDTVISVIDDFVQDLADHNVNMILVGFKDDGSSWDPTPPTPGPDKNYPGYVSGVLMYNSTAYPDFVYSPWKALIDTGFDPMKYLLDKAADASIEVHAWIPAYKDYLASHKKPSGFRKLRLQPGTGEFVRPEDETVLNYEMSVIAEILEMYPSIDGINLDFIRFGDPLDGLGNQLAYWIYWLLDYNSVKAAIVDLVEETSQLLENQVLSVDVFKDDAARYGQDLLALSEIVDVVMPMTYGGGGWLTAEEIETLVASMKADFDPRHLVPIIKAGEDVTSDYVMSCVDAVRASNADGFALFNYADMRLMVDGGLEGIKDVLEEPASTPW